MKPSSYADISDMGAVSINNKKQRSTDPLQMTFNESPEFSDFRSMSGKYVGMSSDFETYLDDILNDSSLPERYKSQIRRIPSLTSPLPEQGLFDNWSNFFLGDSNYNKAMRDREQAAREEISKILDAARQESFNSPAEQSSRLRDAGFNVDLQGVSNMDPGQSTDVDDQSPRASGYGTERVDPLSSLSQVGSTLMSVFNGCMSVITGVQGMVKNGLELDSLSSAIASSDLDMIENVVSNSGLFPSSALSLEDGFYEGEPISFKDKEGNFIPYDKLSLHQRNILDSVALDWANSNRSRQTFDLLFLGHNFSRKKMDRLYNSFYQYMSSPNFSRHYYENVAGFRSFQRQSQEIEESAGFHAFDNLATGLVKALSSAEYSAKTDEELLKSKTYQELLNKGVPEKEAMERARQLDRDQADNLILDNFRDYLLDVVNGVETKDGKKVPKNYDKWDKITAKIGAVLLFLVRNGSSISGNMNSIKFLFK